MRASQVLESSTVYSACRQCPGYEERAWLSDKSLSSWQLQLSAYFLLMASGWCGGILMLILFHSAKWEICLYLTLFFSGGRKAAC